MGVLWCPVIIISILGFLMFESTLYVNGGLTSSFTRKFEKTIDMPPDSDVFREPPGYNAPQQVHITQGDHVGKAMIVSWVTMEEPGSSNVVYWSENNEQKNIVEGIVTTYTFYDYIPGFIHHCNITDLEYDTKYYYEVGIEDASRTFWFATRPEVGPDVSYTFGLIVHLTGHCSMLAEEIIIPTHILLDKYWKPRCF